MTGSSSVDKPIKRPGQDYRPRFCDWHHNIIGERCPGFYLPCREGGGCVQMGLHGSAVDPDRIVLVDGIMIGDVRQLMGEVNWQEQSHNDRMIQHAVKQIQRQRRLPHEVTSMAPGQDVTLSRPGTYGCTASPEECLATGTQTVDAALALLRPLFSGLWEYRDGEGERWERAILDLLVQLKPGDPIVAMLAGQLLKCYMQSMTIDQNSDLAVNDRVKLSMDLRRQFLALYDRCRELTTGGVGNPSN